MAVRQSVRIDGLMCVTHSVVSQEVYSLIEKLRKEELTDAEFKRQFLQLRRECGGNWFTLCTSVPSNLKPYTNEFSNRVRRLVVEADGRCADYIDTSDLDET